MLNIRSHHDSYLDHIRNTKNMLLSQRVRVLEKFENSKEGNELHALLTDASYLLGDLVILEERFRDVDPLDREPEVKEERCE